MKSRRGLLCLVTVVPGARGLPWSSVLALFKPHLALLPLLLAWASKWRGSRRAVIAAVLAVAAANASIFVLDPLFLPHVLAAGIGIGLLLLVAGLQYVLRGMELGRRTVLASSAFAAALLLGAFMVPHKQYGFAVYAPVFACAALLPWRLQALLAPLMACIWRPAILHRLLPGSADDLVYMDIVLLLSAALFAATVVVAFRQGAFRDP